MTLTHVNFQFFTLSHHYLFVTCKYISLMHRLLIQKPWDARNNNHNVSSKMFIKTTLHNFALISSTDRDVNKIYMKGKVIAFTCDCAIPTGQLQDSQDSRLTLFLHDADDVGCLVRIPI